MTPLAKLDPLKRRMTGKGWYKYSGSSFPSSPNMEMPLRRHNGSPSISREGKRTRRANKKKMSKLRALAGLQDSEVRLKELMNYVPVMMWTAGRDELARCYSKRWIEFTGVADSKESNRAWIDAVHPDDLAACLDGWLQAPRDGQPSRVEYRLRRADGVYRWILDQCVTRYDRDGDLAGYVGVCIDVTERKANEEAVRNLSGQLINAQEAERARIARELHDNVGQRVAMLSIDAELIKQGLPSSNVGLRTQLDKLCCHTAELSRDIRRLSHQLHSAMLDHVGLAAATTDLCNQVSQQHGVVIAVLERNVPASIPSNVSLCVFRVLQEALNNMAKHSQTRRARVTLDGSNGVLRLAVSDEGIGFDASVTSCGLGLTSMQERVRLVGGKFSLRSAPDAGTDIIAEVPLLAVTQSNSTRPLPEAGASYAQSARVAG